MMVAVAVVFVVIVAVAVSDGSGGVENIDGTGAGIGVIDAADIVGVIPLLACLMSLFFPLVQLAQLYRKKIVIKISFILLSIFLNPLRSIN